MFKRTLCAGMMLALVTTGTFADEPAGSPVDRTCPSLDMFCVNICELISRLFQGTAVDGAAGSEAAEAQENSSSDREFLEQFFNQAEQLRRQSQAPSACPCPFGQAGDAPKSKDEPLTDEEMQELLESAEFLESEMEALCFGPDEPLDESLLGSEESSEVCPFRFDWQSEGRVQQLTVARAPRDLVLEEESEPAVMPQPAAGNDVLRKVSRIVCGVPALQAVCYALDVLGPHRSQDLLGPQH